MDKSNKTDINIIEKEVPDIKDDYSKISFTVDLKDIVLSELLITRLSCLATNIPERKKDLFGE